MSQKKKKKKFFGKEKVAYRTFCIRIILRRLKRLPEKRKTNKIKKEIKKLNLLLKKIFLASFYIRILREKLRKAHLALYKKRSVNKN